MKKKLLAVFLAMSTLVMSMTGCSNGTANGGDTDKSGDDKGIISVDTSEEGKHELSVIAWDENFNIPALRAAENAYRKKDPEFRLRIIQVSQATDAEDAVTLAGSNDDFSTLPDIILFQDHSTNRFVNDYPNLWQSIDDTKINWNDFSSEKVSYSTVKGVHYGVPVDSGTVIFAYRTDILEQAGYSIDDMTGVTWDRFDAIGRDVYEKTGKYLLSVNADDNSMPYIMMQAEGRSVFRDGKPYFADNETLNKVVDMIVQMARDNVLYLADNYSEYTDQTIKGDMVAGVMNGNWIIPTIESVSMNSGKWEITSLPTFSGKEGYAANGGSSLYITSNCHDNKLARDFLTYTFGGGAGSKETYDNALKKGGVITTNIPAGKSDAYSAGVKYFDNEPVYKKIYEMGPKVKQVEQNDYYYTARQQLSFAIRNVIDGTDTRKALKDAEDQVKFSMGISE